MNDKYVGKSAGTIVDKSIQPQGNWFFPFLGSILLTVAGGFLDITIDKLAGQDISFDLYYLVPVGLSVWYIGIRSGIFIACFSAVSVYVCDLFINLNYFNDVHLFPLFWNTFTGAFFFLCLAITIHFLKQELIKHKLLAFEDVLTNAINSRAFYANSAREIATMKREKHPLTVVYLDLDNFKHINDTFGHDAGDKVLITFTDAVRQNIRSSDILGRLGGDEFALLLPGMSEISAQKFMNNLWEGVQAVMSNHEHVVTFSAGVLTYKNPPLDTATMIKAADEFMYKVKKSGKSGLLFVVIQE